jgi:hypothetical protein
MNSVENDLVLGNLDVFLPVGKAQMEILSKVDEVVERSVAQNNPDIAFDAMNGLLGVSQVSGLAFAKFVYVMSFQWDGFNRRGTFFENAEEQFGRKEITLKRNYNVWEMLVSGDIPKEYCDKFKTMPIRCLIPIATMWKQKWEVEPHQWMMLANAPDPSTINKIIRGIKKKEPKKGSMTIEWDAEAKCITMWKNDIPHPVYLQFDENDEIIKAGLARLFGDGRAMEK